MKIEDNAFTVDSAGFLSSDRNNFFHTDPLLLSTAPVEESFQSINPYVLEELTLTEFVPSLLTTQDNPTFSHVAALTGDEAIIVNAQAAGDTFQVTELLSNSSGFTIKFNRNLDIKKLNLYDGLDEAAEAADLTVTGEKSGEIDGSIVWNPTTNSIKFIKTGGILAADTYNITLVTAGEAIVDIDGNLLDGNGDGTAGDNYSVQFTITASDARVVSLPDIIRGPAQQIDLADNSFGLPIAIDNSGGIDNVSLELTYNPDLLRITKASLGEGLPQDWQIQADLSELGKVKLDFSGSALGTEIRDLIILQAVVAGNGTIGDSQIVSFDKISLNQGNIAVTGDNALHQIGYFGDVSGNGEYSSLDASIIARVAAGLDTGFDIYPNTDPNLIADLSRENAGINREDALLVAKKVVGLGGETIPALPDNLNPTEINFLSPSDGTGMVNLTREAVIRFSEEVDRDTINNDTVKIITSGEEIAGRLVVSSTNKFVTFFPDKPWDASTAVAVKVRGDLIIGKDGQPLDADGDGILGGDLGISFSTLPITQIEGTDVWGYVYDSYNKNPDGTNKPIVGATVRLDALPNLFAVTNETGYFRLENVPAPEFAVHIDGSTAENAPEGTVYATVGKLFHSIPGEETQLTMDGKLFDIYLPPMSADDVQQLSTTEMTEVGFGEAGKEQLQKLFPDIDPSFWDLTKVDFFAGSAQNEQGEIATQAAIIPVDPSRLPAPLPLGQDPRLVISIQAGGEQGFSQAGGATNFDVPAPVQFPNLEGLAPGEKSLIWSFDHDAGAWVIIGTGTVTPDGKSIKSDEGVGVLAPGWHFVDDGTQTNGPKKPNCIGTDEVIETVVDAAQAAAECAQNFVEVRKSIEIIFTIASEIRSLTSSAQNILSDIKNGTLNTTSGFANALAGINSAKTAIISGVDLFKDNASPINKALDISKCIAEAIGFAEELCNRLNKPNSPCGGFITDFVCIGLAAASSTLYKVNSLIGLAQQAQDDLQGLGLALLCGTIDQIASIIGAASSQSSLTLEFADTSSNETIPSEIPSLLQQLIDQGKNYSTEFDRVNELAKSLGELDVNFDNLKNGIAQVRAEFKAIPANTPFIVKYNNFEIRGVTNGSGKIDVVLPSNTQYSITIYDSTTNSIGEINGTTAASGETTQIPKFLMFPVDTSLIDTDGEGLVDKAEVVLGTDTSKIDTDNDGVSDAAEIAQGLDPLGGRAFPTGIIASLPLRGEAKAVTVAGSTTNSQNQTAYIATGSYGIAIVDASQFNNPIIQGQLDLQGDSTDIAVDANLQIAAVASNTGGLNLVDIADAMQPQLLQTVKLAASQVAVKEGIAYATVGNTIYAIDLLTGTELQKLNLSGSGFISDVTIDGNKLYAYTNGSDLFSTIDISSLGAAKIEGELTVSIASEDVGISAGNGIAYLAGSGLQTIDISDPTQPTIIGFADRFFTARDVTINGSGLALVAAEDFGVGLYSTTDLQNTNNFITSFNTTDFTYDVAIASGIAYVADGSGGLQVINYLPFDNKGIAPTNLTVTPTIIDGDPNTEGIQVTEGSNISVGVSVSDDVQVRNIELLVHGRVAANDVSFPWDLSAIAPNITPTVNTVQLQVRATDTGGNVTLSDIFNYNLIEDTQAPQIINTIPASNGVGENVEGITLLFNESLDASLVDIAGITLTNLGTDGVFGDGDDTKVVLNSVRVPAANRIAILPAASLKTGKYRLEVAPNLIGDNAGNLIISTYILDFTATRVLGFDRTDFPANKKPLGINANDFDNDGDIDLVVANPDYNVFSDIAEDNKISILFNNGDGSFATPIQYSAGLGAIATSGDFNGDGSIDLATANREEDNISIFFNNGRGIFTIADTTYSTGNTPSISSPVDLDKDGDLDLIAINNETRASGGFYTGRTISILLNNGDGTFANQEVLTVGNGVANVTTGDFNLDDNLDLATANEGGNTLSVLFNKGDNTYNTPIRLAVDSRPVTIVAQDFNGDGKIDLASDNFVGNTISIRLSNGDGTFARTTNFSTPDYPNGLQTADIDNDGDFDLITKHSVFFFGSNTSLGNSFTILKNDGKGNFLDILEFSVGDRPSGIAIEDFDGDGDLDIVAPNQFNDSISVMLNKIID